MKNRIIYLIIFLSFIGVRQAYTQLFGEEDKQKILADLDSTGYEFLTLKQIVFYKITEAIPILESKFWGKSMTMRLAYLDVMAELNSSSTAFFAYALIDSAETSVMHLPIEIKLNATYSLFKVNDYSTADYIFEWLEEYHQGKSRLQGSFAIRMLPKLLDFPEYEEQVKEELIYVARNEGFADYRSLAIDGLTKKYGDEFIPFLLERVREDTTSYVRWNAFINLRKLDYYELHSLIIERLPLESEYIYRVFYADTLLKRYGQPSDYYFLKNYLPSENHPSAKEMIGLYSKYHKPPKIALSPEIVDNLDSLISYTNQLYVFEWIGNEGFMNNLTTVLGEAKNYILNSDSLLCREKVLLYQQNIDNVFKDSLNLNPEFVLREGWNILYWNAQYILDRLPAIPIVVAADIDVINPAMSLVNPGAFTMEIKGSGFASNSIVYFNGNARTTTFFADTLLYAQILSTDVSVAGNFPVWVSNLTINSDTLIYKVVSSLPKPVRPVLECVKNNGDGTYTAHFGYKNDNDVSVYIPIGNRNKFTPNPQDRGQTRVFKPGRQIKVYTVNFNGSNLVWTLNGRTSTASANSAPCQ
ncbi:MAG TPA: hypothetical protein VLH59_14025 [Ignavibacteriaceae bacterium]|nr:hypothetical protein [Ignavibacteriaceae bacterium]